jgi:hypothetical protein
VVAWRCGSERGRGCVLALGRVARAENQEGKKRASEFSATSSRFQAVVLWEQCRRTAATICLGWAQKQGGRRSGFVSGPCWSATAGTGMHEKSPKRPQQIHSRGGRGWQGVGERARQPRRGGIEPLTHSGRHGEALKWEDSRRRRQRGSRDSGTGKPCEAANLNMKRRGTTWGPNFAS